VGSDHQGFEFEATFSGLEEGLDILHKSIEDLRQATGRGADDRPLMFFETALAEIGNNALLHGNVSSESPVEYVLRSNADTVVAWVIDRGPSVASHWVREMPPANSEAGRGLALARTMLDGLEYQRVGGLNKWKLVKRL
jgi:serine/threonine-protein kinase RsbW